MTNRCCIGFLFSLLVCMTSCEKDDPVICDPVISMQIGDATEGGIVFYLDESNEHGFVVSQEDIGEYPWGCFELDIVSAADTSFGSGNANTMAIAESCWQPSIAATACLEYEHEGYSDWFLPSRDELLMIYDSVGPGNQAIVTIDFSSSWYWSSTQVDEGYAFVVLFNGGWTAGFNKYTAYNVRPIRSF